MWRDSPGMNALGTNRDRPDGHRCSHAGGGHGRVPARQSAVMAAVQKIVLVAVGLAVAWFSFSLGLQFPAHDYDP